MYKLILSFRYLFRKRISYLALSAVALCVFIVVVVMTVMTGLVIGFKQKNHDFVGDCIITSESLVGFAHYEDLVEKLENDDFVKAASPVLKSYGMINAAGSNRNIGVEIMGFDPVKQSKATGFAKTLYHDPNDPKKAFVPAYDPNLPGCVVGIDLWLQPNEDGTRPLEPAPYPVAFELSTFPLTARGALAKSGAGEVSTKVFYYSNNSHTGLVKVDGSMIYIPLHWAQTLCTAGTEKRVTDIFIAFNEGIALDQGRDHIQQIFDDFKKQQSTMSNANLLDNVSVQTWKQYRRTFIAAMEKEQAMLTAMFALVGITTVFIIFVVFYMIISHKTKDIGILKSVGISKGNVVALFADFALMLALVGAGVGTVTGWIFLRHINQIEQWMFKNFGWQVWNRSLYVGIDQIPNQVDFKVLSVIIISAVLACLLGAIIPSYQAAKLKPVDTLQVNQL